MKPQDETIPKIEIDADELLATVYGELRNVARHRLAQLPPGQTLSATALVHEVWLRIEGSPTVEWKSRAHFFAAAGTLMRNILVDRVREKSSLKRGGEHVRVDLTTRDLGADTNADLEAVHEALDELEAEDARAAQLVMLRFFAGMTLEEAAEALEMSERSARRDWKFAKAWLYRALTNEDDRN